MNENLAYKINSSFHLLGLKPGADARQIQSAFRRLARTYHPDVAGAFHSKKFEQISNAYLLLKNLTDEERSLCEVKPRPHEANVKKSKESFFARWKRSNAEKEAKREAEQREKREAEEAAKEASEIAQSLRIDSILEKCENGINSIIKRKQKDKLMLEVSDFIVRLEASRYEVRLMAARKISKYANAPQVPEALLNMLNKYPLTGEMIDIVDKHQWPREFMQKFVKIVSDNVCVLSEHEIFPFIRKIIFMTVDDKNVISRLMEHPSLKITEFLIARWMFPTLPGENVLKRIFSNVQNEKLIITTLNMLKRYDKSIFSNWLTQRIRELLAHDGATVRIWARAVLSNENVVK